MNLLTVENLTKAYTDRKLFDNVEFSINEGDKIGIIGINGTGKTTLLKLISDIEKPDTGKITKGNNINIRYLPQNPVFDKNNTVLETVLSGNIRHDDDMWSVEGEAKAILNKLGISDYNTGIQNMSGGQRKRAALANTLMAKADILILDEPTNHLDSEMSRWLEEYLNRFRGALVMVTHDRYFLDRVTNRIVEIDKSKLYSYAGGYSEFLRLKSAREDIENASERKRQSLLRTELEWISRGARARSTKQKARIERFEELKEANAPIKDESIKLDSLSSRLGKKTVEINNISKSYDSKKLIDDFSYIFLKNDRIGIIGPNGCGKSTLLKIINNVVQPDDGCIDIGATVRIGYFSQENEYMDESLKVIEYVREGAEYIETSDGKISASQMLERFLFDGTAQWSLISRLSGGEKRRLYLLRVLMEAPNVLILDEPTNDLDIQTMTILEDYLDGFDGIVITVSHDRYFLDRIVKRIFSFEGSGEIKQYEGNYSDYLQKHVSVPTDTAADINLIKEKAVKPKSTKLKFTYAEQREFETIEENIKKIEKAVEELDSRILASASDFVKLNELMDQKEQLEHELEEKMDRWLYLTDLAERIEQEKASR